jgi:hypothetical protein
MHARLASIAKGDPNMAQGLAAPALTQLEFKPEDFDIAERVARRLGYEQTAYTSTSALWGLFCLPENPATWRGPRQALSGGCIIKTKELGFMFVQNLEDLHMADDDDDDDGDDGDDAPQFRHTTCKHCGQDIEGKAPFTRGEWRDRGNNRTCPDSKRGRKHAPVSE